MNRVSVTLFVCLYLLWCLRSQIPVQDECQYLNATVPPQCPSTIGPPCPPCIVNEQHDYNNGDFLNFSTKTIKLINDYMNNNVDYWLNTWPPSKIYPPNRPSDIGQGAAGRALLFYRLYRYTKNDSYLNIAHEYITVALNVLPHLKPQFTSYHQGFNGVYTVAAQIAYTQNNTDNFLLYISNINNIINDVMNGIYNNYNISPIYGFDMKDCPIWTGLSGLLYNMILINTIFDDDNIISHKDINDLAIHIINVGFEFSKQQNVNYLTYYTSFDHDCHVVGIGDGNGGIIRTLFAAYLNGYLPQLYDNKTIYDAIKTTMDWFVSIQFDDGNMPTYYNNTACAQIFGNDTDARVQWCFGAPGFIDTYSKAAIVFDHLGQTNESDKYFESALKAYNSTWNRGLLIKGLMQCHGIGGNIYTLLNMFENLQILQESNYFNNKYNISYLINESGFRAKQFIKWTLNDNNLQHLRTNYSNQDFAFWYGSYGIPILYIQTIQSGWPFKVPVCMIGWNFCPF